jgi:hypothetical protein
VITPVPITWSGSQTVSGSVSVISDWVSTNVLGFSAAVSVTGTGSGGIGGSLVILVSNNGGSTYSILPGSLQSVLVNNGSTEVFNWSSSAAFSSVALGWYVGGSTNGQLSNGDWAIVPAASSGGGSVIPPVVVLPSVFASLQQLLSNQFGVDILCLTDLDPNFTLTQNALIQDVYHLITEQPGSLFWAPSSTTSILFILSQGTTPAILQQQGSRIQAVISADERIAQCQVLVSFDGSQTVTISISVTPQLGVPFQFVLSVTGVTITLLSVGLTNQ